MISIIIPAYNAEKYLEECINSILCNTISDFEIIIVNDGSTDSTPTICKRIASSDNRIKIFSQNNGGVSSARNYGIKQAKGELIMFVDADDLIGKCYIEKIVQEIGNADFLCSGFSLFESDYRNPVNRYSNVEFDGSIKEYANRLTEWINPPFLLSPWCKVFRKVIIEKNNISFHEDMSYGEDVVFVFDYLIKSSTVKCINTSDYYYRKSSNTLSKGYRSDILKSDMLGLKKINEFLTINESANKQIVICERYVDIYTLFIKRLIKSNLNYREKKATFLKSVNQYNPIKYYKKRKIHSFGTDLIYLVLKCPYLFFLLEAFNLQKGGI